MFFPFFLPSKHTIDGLATSAVEVGEVTTLEHEVRDNAMEDAALVAETRLTSAELAEVLSSLWDHVGKQLHNDALTTTHG